MRAKLSEIYLILYCRPTAVKISYIQNFERMCVFYNNNCHPLENKYHTINQYVKHVCDASSYSDGNK